MVDTLIRLDISLLKRFQKWSDAIQSTWGADCFVSAKIMATITGLGMVTTTILIFFTGDLFITGVVMYATYKIYLSLTKLIIKYERKNTVQNFVKNNAAIELIGMRVVHLFMTVATFLPIVVVILLPTPKGDGGANDTKMLLANAFWLKAFVAFLVSIISAGSCIYFCSCTPKPPGMSKIKKLLHSIRTSLTPSPNLVPG